MATYNGERYLRRQLESILRQLGANDELVVSDDSSTDATVDIIESFADTRIRLSTGNTFFSPIFNFEHALKMATGEIIVLADQDDVWLDNKLAVIREKFAAPHQRCYLIALDGYVVDEDEAVVSDSIFERLGAGKGFWRNLFNNRYLGCCLAFSRELLGVALPFPQRIPMHDMWLGQLCELVGETEFVAEKTIKYRKHGASLTEFRIRFMPWLQLKRRWFLLYYLLRRAGARNEEKGARIKERGTRITSNPEPRTPNLEPRTSNLEPRTSNLEPRTSNLEPRTLNLEPRTSNLEPRTLNLEPRTPNLDFRSSVLEPRTSVLISIVMPSFNQVAFLEEAVCSVLDQPVDLELLVMDPGSTDGSRELLSSLKERYGDRLVLHFAPDRGQSDAVNRGMALARGTLLGWLNSDDRLRLGALARVVECLDSREPSWIYGRAGVIDAEGRPVSSLMVRYKNWRGRRFSRFKLLTENFIPQMAVFWNRAMWDRAGELDIGKELDMDYDLWFRFARIAPPMVLADDFADFRVHGQAKGSMLTAEQLRAAYLTARSHAAPLGVKGLIALAFHRILSMRTRILYMLMKP